MRGEDPGLPRRVHGEHVEGLRMGPFHSGRPDRHAWNRQAGDAGVFLEQPPHVLGRDVTLHEVPADEGGVACGKSLLFFGLGLLVVYLTLSAQYESFVLPFIILLAVPMAVLGALAAQKIRGLENDVYCQIGLVMLVGLSSKNAILIVEFAE